MRAKHLWAAALGLLSACGAAQHEASTTPTATADVTSTSRAGQLPRRSPAEASTTGDPFPLAMANTPATPPPDATADAANASESLDVITGIGGDLDACLASLEAHGRRAGPAEGFWTIRSKSQLDRELPCERDPAWRFPTDRIFVGTRIPSARACSRAIAVAADRDRSGGPVTVRFRVADTGTCTTRQPEKWVFTSLPADTWRQDIHVVLDRTPPPASGP